MLQFVSLVGGLYKRNPCDNALLLYKNFFHNGLAQCCKAIYTVTKKQTNKFIHM